MTSLTGKKIYMGQFQDDCRKCICTFLNSEHIKIPNLLLQFRLNPGVLQKPVLSEKTVKAQLWKLL